MTENRGNDPSSARGALCVSMCSIQRNGYFGRQRVLRLRIQREEHVQVGDRNARETVLEQVPRRAVALEWREGDVRTEQMLIWQPSVLQLMLWRRMRGRISKHLGQFASVQFDVW